jgi:chemotaxis methyl-accepting protein methylase
MTLVEELSSELSRSAGLRVEQDWASQIHEAIQRCGGAAGARGGWLDPERKRSVLSEIARRVTVPESYFFRNAAQLAVCADHAEAVWRRGGAKARIWCAGCAGGEEPYSLALLLYRRVGALLAAGFEISASDLNRDALDKAESALYTSWSFRGAPSWCFPFFATESDARLRLCRGEVKGAVNFAHESCQVGAKRQTDASLDVVLFRNVAIYLETAATSELYDEFARVLRPGALLALGPSDPRPNGDDFELLGHFDHAPLFVRRTAQVSAPAMPQAPVVPRRNRLRVPSEPAVAASLELVETLVEKAPLDATAQRLLGLVHLQNGEAARAVSVLRQAVFLDADDALSRYFYALALREHGDLAQAGRQLRNVLGSVSGRAPSDLLSDGSTTAAELGSAAAFLESQWK